MGRALVLGSGGATGLAWQAGVLAGLADAGVDLSADLVVGTSAGALIGARLACGWTPDAIANALVGGGAHDHDLVGALDDARLAPSAVARLLVAQVRPDRRHALEWLGRRAARDWSPEGSGRWVDSLAGDLAGLPCPDGLVVVATDAVTGRPAFLGATRPVDLAEAVAASCAMPGVFPAVRVGDRLLFDGGLRSPANLDVAGAADTVLALAPLTGSVRAYRRPSVQAARLRRAGTSVLLLTPDAAGRRAIGVDVLAAARLPSALAAGRRLGASHAAAVSALWR